MTSPLDALPLFPPIEPFATGALQVDKRHTIYYEQVGNQSPDAPVAVFVHGGPGGGCDATCRRYFDPEKWRVILFDQRGCGRSTPHADLVDNTTWHLIEDMERIRIKLGIEQWTVFGGSWGSTLALSYAIMHPERTQGLILRGIFTLREQELKWFYQEGASYLYPDAWEHYIGVIPHEERDNLMVAYHQRLTSDNEEERLQAALAWSIWEGSTSRLIPNFANPRHINEKFALAFARIENHYFVNKGFFEEDGWILNNVDCIRHIPTVIVQGRYDVVCPMQTAWDLYKRFPEAELVVISDAGHTMLEPGICQALVEATQRFLPLPNIS